MSDRVFPRTIFQIWFQGETELPPKFAEGAWSWQQLNPEWTHRLLDGPALRRECWAYSEAAGRAYDAMPLLHLKVDFAKFVVLARHGGIYVDADCFPFRPLDSSEHVRQFIERHEAGEDVVGLSPVYVPALDMVLYTAGRHARMLNNGVILCSPDHPLVHEFVRHMIGRFDARPTAGIEHLTGPSVVTAFFEGKPGVVVFPQDIFEPCNPLACALTDDTVGIHKFEMSWLSKREKAAVLWFWRWRTALSTALVVVVAWLALKGARHLLARRR